MVCAGGHFLRKGNDGGTMKALSVRSLFFSQDRILSESAKRVVE